MKITKCIGKCCLDSKKKYCTGCNRTIEHITNWRNYSEAQRNEIIGQKFTYLRTINKSYGS